MILDIPRFKAFINTYYLTNGEKGGLEECYVFAVTLIENRPLLFTIHTENGAVYSRVPINSFSKSKTMDLIKAVPLKYLDPWGAISSNGQVITHKYLKDYEVECKIGPDTQSGRYLFTIDYFDGGFSEDPEQHKTTNIIELENGHIAALPNNYCVFKDTHFTSLNGTKHYKRNSIYYW